MDRAYNVILALSLIANGGLAGLIAGHVLSTPLGCQCGDDCDCGRRREIRDEGPFPTGWVVPEPGPMPGPVTPPKPPKPDGAKR